MRRGGLTTKVAAALQKIGAATAREVAAECGLADDPAKFHRVRCILSKMKAEGLASTQPGASGELRYQLAPPVGQQATAGPSATPARQADDRMPIQFADIEMPTPLGPIKIDLGPLVSQLMGGMAERIQPALYEGFREMLRREVPSAWERACKDIELDGTGLQPPDLVRQTKLEKPARRPAVTVVGLLPGQASMIKDEFGTEFSLHFVTSAKNEASRLHGLCKTSDAVLTMTGFISHSLEKIIKSSGVRLVRVNGGMSSLRDELTTLYIQAGEPKEIPA